MLDIMFSPSILILSSLGLHQFTAAYARLQSAGGKHYFALGSRRVMRRKAEHHISDLQDPPTHEPSLAQLFLPLPA